MKTSSSRREIPVRNYRELNVLDPKLAAKMQEFRLKLSVVNAGYPVTTDWHPVIPDGWGEFPSAPFQRSVVYRGSASTWAYSHHTAITKFGDKYVATWSNGLLHEDYVGQEVHLAWSTDGLHWSEPQVVVHTPLESKIVRNNAGVCSANGLLYCYVGVAKDYGRDITPPGMYSYDKQKIPLDVYVTSDLKNWEHHPGICDNILLVEGPRPSPDGTFMCCGFDMTNMQAVVLAWDDSTRLAMPPRVIRIPPSPEGLLPEEGTWYQTDDGRIWMYQRDFTGSCRLGLTWSDDRGDTWSDLLPTNFPNSLSRAFVGRLPDGRYYIVGNNYDILLNRKHMLIALSDDGYVFNKQYKLIGGNTTRRVNGRHKEDGYHYPNCYAEDDKLFVIYSVNKEDIEVGIVDTGKL